MRLEITDEQVKKIPIAEFALVEELKKPILGLRIDPIRKEYEYNLAKFIDSVFGSRIETPAVLNLKFTLKEGANFSYLLVKYDQSFWINFHYFYFDGKFIGLGIDNFAVDQEIRFYFVPRVDGTAIIKLSGFSIESSRIIP